MNRRYRSFLAAFFLSVSARAQEITVGSPPPTRPIPYGTDGPGTWAEVFASAAIRPRQTAPASAELRSCNSRVTTPDSLFLTTLAAAKVKVWSQVGGGEWTPISISTAKPDTLAVRVVNLDCGYADPLALVVGTEKYFLRLNSSAFLGESASIDELETASVLVRGKGGAREPAKLVRPKCDSCAYTVVSDQPRLDSISQRIALARSRLEAQRRAEIDGQPLRVAAAIKAYEEDSLRRVRAAKAQEAYIKSRKWPAAVKAAIFAGKIRFGMTREQVRLSWGEPDDINRTVIPGRVSEQWVYGEQYVYFVNGVVTAWQD